MILLGPLSHLLHLALSATDVQEKSGIQSNGQFHIATGSTDTLLQQFHLLMKMTLMIPLTC